MITANWLKPGEGLITGDAGLLADWQQFEDSFLWLDIQMEGEEPEEVNQLLADFDCDMLAVRDVMRKRHPPKLEVFNQHVFILYRGISQALGNLDFEHQQIGLFIGERFLLTVHPSHSIGVSRLQESSSLAQYIEQPLLLALKIMHRSSDAYLENLLEFESELGEKEDALQSGHGELQLGILSSYRIKLLRLRRVFSYHEQMLQELRGISIQAEAGSPISDLEHSITDVYERFERLLSLSCLYYEMCSNIVEGYISITSHQQNMSLRLLTVITTIFVPLGFLAGLYGMNFERIPELHHPNGYFILLGVMATLAVSLLIIFKRKHWF